MADRRPIVIVNGQKQELAPPDTLPADILPATSGGGSSARSFFLS